MKCYFHQEQTHFFDYFKDPVPDDEVINVGNVPFQYNEREFSLTIIIPTSCRHYITSYPVTGTNPFHVLHNKTSVTIVNYYLPNHKLQLQYHNYTLK